MPLSLVVIVLLVLVRQVIHSLVRPCGRLLLVLHLHRGIEAPRHALRVWRKVVGEGSCLGGRIGEHCLVLLLDCRHGAHVEIRRILHRKSARVHHWRFGWILKSWIGLVGVMHVICGVACITTLVRRHHLGWRVRVHDVGRCFVRSVLRDSGI